LSQNPQKLSKKFWLNVWHFAQVVESITLDFLERKYYIAITILRRIKLE